MFSRAFFLALIVAASCLLYSAESFAPPATHAVSTTNSLSVPVLQAKKKNDDDNNRVDRQSFYEKEQESSRKVMSNLLTFDGLGSVITTAGWTFVVVGLILPSFGYDFVVKDGKLTIDTVETRQFQNEVRKSMKAKRSSGAVVSTSSESIVSKDVLQEKIAETAGEK